MNRRTIALAATCALAATLCSGCSTLERGFKSFRSDMTGGIERTVTVYAYDGTEIASWDGKIDYEYSDGRVMFDMEDGRRISIMGGTVITEEAAR